MDNDKLLVGVFMFCLSIASVSARFGGGYRHDVSTDDKTIQRVANWAASQLGGQLVNVKSAQEQVVAGLMFYIEMEIMTRTESRKFCEVKVWVQEWRDFRKLMPGSRCNAARQYNF